MSGISRRGFLETTAATAAGVVLAPWTEAGEPVAPRSSIRDVNCNLNDAVFEEIRKNIAYVFARYPQLEGCHYGSGVVLSISERERGPTFDPTTVYILSCRHCIARFLSDDKGERQEELSNAVSVQISVGSNRRVLVEQPATVLCEPRGDREIALMPDLALLSFKRDTHQYPDGIPLYSGSVGSLWLRDITLAGRPHGGSPRIVNTSISDIANINSALVYSGKLHNLISDYPVYFGHSGGAAVVHEYGPNVASLKDVRSSLAGITFGNCTNKEGDEAVNTLSVPIDDIRTFLIGLGILAPPPKKIEVAAKPLK
jgi:hypothetical protein